MSTSLPMRLVDSFMAPKDILQEFADLTKVNSFILQKVFTISIKLSSDLPVKLVDSFTAPKYIHQEFTDLAEEGNDNPFILLNVFT